MRKKESEREKERREFGDMFWENAKKFHDGAFGNSGLPSRLASQS